MKIICLYELEFFCVRVNLVCQTKRAFLQRYTFNDFTKAHFGKGKVTTVLVVEHFLYLFSLNQPFKLFRSLDIWTRALTVKCDVSV